MQRQLKPGWKTTEFWLTIVTTIITALSVIPTPEHYKPIIAAALVGLYAVSRGLAKLKLGGSVQDAVEAAFDTSGPEAELPGGVTPGPQTDAAIRDLDPAPPPPASEPPPAEVPAPPAAPGVGQGE